MAENEAINSPSCILLALNQAAYRGSRGRTIPNPSRSMKTVRNTISSVALLTEEDAAGAAGATAVTKEGLSDHRSCAVEHLTKCILSPGNRRARMPILHKKVPQLTSASHQPDTDPCQKRKQKEDREECQQSRSGIIGPASHKLNSTVGQPLGRLGFRDRSWCLRTQLVHKNSRRRSGRSTVRRHETILTSELARRSPELLRWQDRTIRL